MLQTLLTNWKTSGAAAMVAVLAILNHFYPEVFTTDLNVKIVGAITAVGLLLSKDANVTGGTVVNSPNDASVVKDATRKDLP